MQLSICSYSFNRLLAAGKQDVFKYITDCKELGCTQLDPWNGHLAELKDAEQVLQAGQDPEHAELSAQDDDYIRRVKAAGDAAGLPFGCIAVDGAHIYDDKPEYRKLFRSRAYRWIQIAQMLGAQQIRLDSGGTHEMPEEMFDIIVDGFRDLVARAGEANVQVVMENHWGASQVPENVVRIMDTVPGLGLLFDTHNWAPGRQQDGWKMCAKYASITHVKTFDVSDDLVESSTDLNQGINTLLDAGYNGCWGIESCPTDGDEYAGVRKTIQLTKNALAQRAQNGAAHVR
ncbi:MAG TPA: TIM barrel protein [Abditibacteriaceae bacterium]|nr:TIM barrel protein [Abditibacteriaceae bacterium]